MLKQTRTTILLSVNAVVVLLVGIMLANVLSPDASREFRILNEHSDDIEDTPDETELLPDIAFDEMWGKDEDTGAGNNSSKPNDKPNSNSPSTGGEIVLGEGELWSRTAATLYVTADTDICIDAVISNIGDLYWQTDNKSVIAGFYTTSRESLGFPKDRCRYPKIVGTGTATVTAGTYDGKYRDSIKIEVKPVPIEEWKREVLRLVNAERAKIGVTALIWGDTCAVAADIRARELVASYSHTRPDGSPWNTACPVPTSGGASGENVFAGNAAVSPKTVVAGWMASTNHRANILNAAFTRLAVGFYFDPNTELRTYWEQYFSTY
jgi:hypothetical protein